MMVFSSSDIGRYDMGDPQVFGHEDLLCDVQGDLTV